jgi:uncharacterized protein (TIGR02453 family)
MLSNTLFDFLNKLAVNNNREWFQANKKQFDQLHQEVADFLNQLIPEISKFDSSIVGLDAKKSIFRIYRDTRFSKDKTPYKTHFGAHLLAGGRKSEHASAGYYLRLEPGKSILAGGAYLPPSAWINAIRDEIAHNGNALRDILNHPSFKTYFGTLQGETLKTTPKGFPKDHPEIALLRQKSFLAVHNLEDRVVSSKDFLHHCSNVFKALHPLDEFLNNASSN